MEWIFFDLGSDLSIGRYGLLKLDLKRLDQILLQSFLNKGWSIPNT